MNRVLRRPMFRTGGSAEGITSGLQPRQGLAYSGVAGELSNRNKPNNTKPDEGTSMMEKLMFNKSMVEALAPRTPRKDTSMRDFLINFGLDIASRPASGSIFSTAAASAKEPFAKFQQAKQIEDAYGAKETESDRALIADMIKGMNDDELSALMKDVQAGVDAGLWTEKQGIIKLLKKKVYGVQKEEGEVRGETIETRAGILLERDEDMGYDSAIAIANAAQDIFDGKVEGVTADQIDTDQLYVEPETWAYMGTPNEETGIYTVPTDANDGDKNDFQETYTEGMIYYNYRNKMWYQKSGKQLIPLQQPE